VAALARQATKEGTKVKTVATMMAELARGPVTVN